MDNIFAEPEAAEPEASADGDGQIEPMEHKIIFPSPETGALEKHQLCKQDLRSITPEVAEAAECH